MVANERIEEFSRGLARLRSFPGADAEMSLPRFPLTMRVTYHDGPGAQFFDRDGRPVLFDLVRDEEQALQLHWMLNKLAEKAGLI